MQDFFGLSPKNVQPIGNSSLGMLGVPLGYRGNTPQRRFHRNVRDARFACVNAGRRGGKTEAGAAEFARRVVRDMNAKIARVGPWVPPRGRDPEPFLEFCVIAPTFALSKEPRKALQRMFGLSEDEGLVDSQRADDPWILNGGVYIYFLSGDRPERLVGKKWAGCWLEEGSRLKEAVWVDSTRPALADSNGWAIMTSTPMGLNWYYTLYAKGNLKIAEELAAIEGRPVSTILDPNYISTSWTTAENDALPGLVAEMEQARLEMPPNMFRRNFLADFNSFLGACFDLDVSRHFAKTPPPNPASVNSIYAGADLGWTDSSSFTVTIEARDLMWEEVDTISAPGIAYDSDDDWARKGQMSRSEIARATWTTQCYHMLNNYCGSAWSSVEFRFPHDRPEIRDQFTKRGFNTSDAFQDGNAALNFFQGALHQDRFLIRSPELWRSITGLHFPEKGKKSRKIWVADDDHVFDSCRHSLSWPIMTGASPYQTSVISQDWASR